MKYFVSNNNGLNSDLEFNAEAERSTVNYYVYDEGTPKSNPSIVANHNLTDCKILVVKCTDNTVTAAKEIVPYVQKVLKLEDACINEFMRTIAVLVRSDKLDVIRLACEFKKVKYTVFDTVRDFITFDEALADID